MVPKSLSNVELKKCTQNVTGRAGLSWMNAGLVHMRFFEKIDALMSCSGASNRSLPMSIKLGSEILSRIDGSSAIEDVEVLRKDVGLQTNVGNGAVSADTIRNIFKEEETAKCQKEVNRWLGIEAMKRSAEKCFTYDNDATKG